MSATAPGRGRMLTYDKVAAVCVVGAHKVSADPFQALDDLGFSLAPNAVSHLGREAMHETDYQDYAATPEASAVATATLATNTVHLVRHLKTNSYSAS
ncbi:hypothetical protein ACFQ60_04005 [Streptomyces zhihengii]|uniref:Uncharacterized protein n=1 Tax=Streptomyces zhihengii TaxID=1818004 RepID=A0ABS2V267_9ACTN|nr:hypothetical protein [Streptomyces zhihengii]MBM9623931.1 hypothetical protein [Streptomyces zhihengii]